MSEGVSLVALGVANRRIYVSILPSQGSRNTYGWESQKFEWERRKWERQKWEWMVVWSHFEWSPADRTSLKSQADWTKSPVDQKKSQADQT